DGACSGNPGKGGWGAVLVYNGKEKELSGFNAQTTNNRMELTAVIEALKALKEPCSVTLTTDSKYVCDAVNKGWVFSWEANGWRKADKKPALNVDLWEELLALLEEHEVEFIWVKGHDGHKYNERCDKLAVDEYMNN
ncbi:MAG: ribonuclease HI, partial [Eubacterium sp.]|nr:ribonuclease HI [Eubacterium sp.]